jgi:hypothetical protein
MGVLSIQINQVLKSATSARYGINEPPSPTARQAAQVAVSRQAALRQAITQGYQLIMLGTNTKENTEFRFPFASSMRCAAKTGSIY